MIEMDPELISEITSRGKRIDGRAFEAYRDVTIETNLIGAADGSARVKLGNTEIIAGVKIELGTPYPDSPADGVLTCSSEFIPLASSEFERGPPSEDSVELSRVVDRAIRESKCIDMSKLCIKPEEVIWMIYIDMDVLSDDGNLIDAACIAAVAALASAKMPKLIVEGDKHSTDNSVHEGKLPMSAIPVSITLAKVGNSIIVDPNLAEWKAIAARLTVGTKDTSDGIKLCSMQKGGDRGLKLEEVERMIDLGVEKGEEIRAKIKQAVGK